MINTYNNEAIKKAFEFVNPKMAKAFMPWILKNPKYFKNAFGLVKSFYAAEKKRELLLKEDIIIPPILILSITSKCNLFCTNCFASALGNIENEQNKYHEMNLATSDWQRIIDEGEELGIFCYLIAGGEPFLFPGLIQLCEKNNHSLFIIFTNGTLLKTKEYEELKKITNVGIIVSIEGDEEITDTRRGENNYNKAIDTIMALEKCGIFSGISVTITNNNYKYWMEERGIDYFIENGVRLAFFTELIPVSTKTNLGIHTKGKDKPLSSIERKEFRERILYYKNSKEIFIVHSPGDEELFGGCVSAGKGFAHITPKGDMTPCPVSNIATHNLKNASLLECLKSPLFTEIREHESLLENSDGPCALFEHKKELEILRQRVGAYYTNIL